MAKNVPANNCHPKVCHVAIIVTINKPKSIIFSVHPSYNIRKYMYNPVLFKYLIIYA